MPLKLVDEFTKQVESYDLDSFKPRCEGDKILYEVGQSALQKLLEILTRNIEYHLLINIDYNNPGISNQELKDLKESILSTVNLSIFKTEGFSDRHPTSWLRIERLGRLSIKKFYNLSIDISHGTYCTSIDNGTDTILRGSETGRDISLIKKKIENGLGLYF